MFLHVFQVLTRINAMQNSLCWLVCPYVGWYSLCRLVFPMLADMSVDSCATLETSCLLPDGTFDGSQSRELPRSAENEPDNGKRSALACRSNFPRFKFPFQDWNMTAIHPLVDHEDIGSENNNHNVWHSTFLFI